MIRWFSIATVLGGVLSLGVGPAHAQSADKLHANIPFDFKVGHTTLPAGSYEVSYDAALSPGLLVVRSQDGHHVVFVLTESVDTRNPKRDATLVFEREGEAYALSEVFAPEARAGLEVLGTHATD